MGGDHVCDIAEQLIHSETFDLATPYDAFDQPTDGTAEASVVRQVLRFDQSAGVDSGALGW